MNYYDNLNDEVRNYFRILSPKFPEWLLEYIDTYEMRRIGTISMSCGTDGEKLYVADTHNNRILVYNSIPTMNGQNADYEITMYDSKNSISWPWAIWTNGEKLIVTDTRNGKLLIWNNIDDLKDRNADIIINTGGTPRTIVSDGNWLLVGDHNYNGGQFASRIWSSFPENNNDTEDFAIPYQFGGEIINNNLYAMDNDGNIYIYAGVIDSKEEKATAYIKINKEGFDYYQSGDYNSIVYVDGKTFVSFYNSSYIGVFNGTLDANDTLSNPDYLIGVDNITESVNVDNGIYQNVISATNGKQLVGVDDYNRLLLIWNNVPDEDNIKADEVYKFNTYNTGERDLEVVPNDIEITSDNKMIVLTNVGLFVWNGIPTNGEKYDEAILYKQVSDNKLNNSNDRLAIDNDNIYIFDNQENILKVYSKTTNDVDNPISTYQFDTNMNIDSNGKYLLLTNTSKNSVDVYGISSLNKKVGTIGTNDNNNEYKLNQPLDAIITEDDTVIVSDSSNNRILIWNNLDGAIKFETPSTILGKGGVYTIDSVSNGIKRTDDARITSDSSVYFPQSLTCKNGHLWVGEYKFSSRLVRYDLKEEQ